MTAPVTVAILMIRVSVDFVFVGVSMSIPISAALGIKRGLDDTHSRSESPDHTNNHMIVADQEAVVVMPQLIVEQLGNKFLQNILEIIHR